MRDIFADIFIDAPRNPMDAARRGMRPQLRRRFYQHAEVGTEADSFAVLLDGKPVRTPAAQALAAPVRALAEAIAAEWEAQRDVIDPKNMPLTRLANSIIDGVTAKIPQVVADVANYLGSDLLCYRAGGPDALRARQEQQWNPVLDWASRELDARFILAEGVTHVRQPETAVANAARAILSRAPHDDPRKIVCDVWRLGALHSITSLTGSALLALALMYGRMTVEQVCAAAHVDEDFQMEQWGRDELALEQRAFRRRDLDAAGIVLAHLPS